MASIPEPPYLDYADLREGPDLHPALLPFLPLIGTWRGSGQGRYPTIEDFHYGQQVTFSHDGRPFLRYESKSWLTDADGEFLRPAARELGWWRPGEGTQFEVLLVTHTGVAEVFVGQANTATQWELTTDVVARTGTAKEVNGEHRLYGIVDRALMYAADLAAVGQPLQPHISARLERVGG